MSGANLYPSYMPLRHAQEQLHLSPFIFLTPIQIKIHIFLIQNHDDHHNHPVTMPTMWVIL